MNGINISPRLSAVITSTTARSAGNPSLVKGGIWYQKV